MVVILKIMIVIVVILKLMYSDYENGNRNFIDNDGNVGDFRLYWWWWLFEHNDRDYDGDLESNDDDCGDYEHNESDYDGDGDDLEGNAGDSEYGDGD